MTDTCTSCRVSPRNSIRALGQISIGHQKIKRLCTSMTQVRRERRASMKFYRERDARLYSFVRIPASAFDGGAES